ncbi:MAG: hypothetical protein MZV70_09045 [Desulfobacterales bacterium]|nr:hypothetical protein [Desulfobacterales bacterium]
MTGWGANKLRCRQRRAALAALGRAVQPGAGNAVARAALGAAQSCRPRPHGRRSFQGKEPPGTCRISRRRAPMRSGGTRLPALQLGQRTISVFAAFMASESSMFHRVFGTKLIAIGAGSKVRRLVVSPLSRAFIS